MPEVDMLKIRRGYWCFHRVLKFKGNARTWLVGYCGDTLPLSLTDFDYWHMSEEAAHRLEALQGPYGDIIAKAFIVKYGKRK